MKVEGRGNPNAKVLLIGEKPGRDEIRSGEVWCGRAGKELDMIRWKCGIGAEDVWMDNLLQDLPTGDEGSTCVADLDRNRQHIQQTIADLPNLEVIVAMGQVAAKYFIPKGDKNDLHTVHGIPLISTTGHQLLPVTHPASGLHDAESYPYIYYDFKNLQRYLQGHDLWGGGRVDRYPQPKYQPLVDRDAAFIRHYFERRHVEDLYIDTEGSTRSPWCLSWTDEEGVGYVIKTKDGEALAAFAQAIYRHLPTVWMHYAAHDIPVLRTLGVQLVESGVQVLDTMVAAYLLQIEPRGLKDLAWRHVAMRMSDYMDVVGPYDLEKQVEWLIRVGEVEWGKSPEILLEEKMGVRVTRPRALNTTIGLLLEEINATLDDPDVPPVDIRKRWSSIHPLVRGGAEARFGLLPSGSLDDVDPETACNYAARDADATLRVGRVLMERLKEQDLLSTFEMDCAVVKCVEEYESGGMGVDVGHFEGLITKWRAAQGKLRWEIKQMPDVARVLNPESAPQVSKLLYEDLKLPCIKQTEGGKGSTSDKAIDWMADKHPVIPKIQLHREYDKGVTSFAEPIISFCRIDSGRVARDTDSGDVLHPNLKYASVVSGRFAANEPNVLAMPVRTGIGKEIRAGFIARPGKLLGAADLNQMEMRFMAHESGDKDLISSYQRGVDVHKETAARMFGVEMEGVTDEQRDPAKRVSFGVITGITGMGLKDQFWLNGITQYDERDCDKLIKLWFEARPGVRGYLEGCRAEARRWGWVRESIGGRKRDLQAVYSTDPRMAAEHERASHSHRISSGAQAYIKIAMAKLWPVIEELRRDKPDSIRWWLQVHDELIFEFDEGLEGVLGAVVRDVLESAVKLKVPVKSSWKVAKNWSKLK